MASKRCHELEEARYITPPDASSPQLSKRRRFVSVYVDSDEMKTCMSPKQPPKTTTILSIPHQTIYDCLDHCACGRLPVYRLIAFANQQSLFSSSLRPTLSFLLKRTSPSPSFSSLGGPEITPPHSLPSCRCSPCIQLTLPARRGEHSYPFLTAPDNIFFSSAV